jgi:hypothetical protein
MKVLFIASFAPVVAEPAVAKKLFVDGLNLEFEGAHGDYVFTDKLGGAKHFGLWPLEEAAEACFGTKTWPRDTRVPQASLELELESAEAVAAAEAELRAKGHTLLHATRTEPWGQVIARLLSSDGLIVGVCWTPWFHEKK